MGVLDLSLVLRESFDDTGDDRLTSLSKGDEIEEKGLEFNKMNQIEKTVKSKIDCKKSIYPVDSVVDVSHHCLPSGTLEICPYDDGTP